MKKLIASALTFALLFGAHPVITPVAAQGTGSLSGVATDAGKAVMSGVKVQLRNVDTGTLAGQTTSAANGGFSFSGLPAGNYVIEIVDATGKVIGVSASIALAAGAVITGLAVSASAAGAVAGAAAAAGAGGFFTSTGGILVLSAVGVGVSAGLVAAANDASPSQ